ncbi:phage tail protein [Salmonella enterica subsp. diarizonae]|nr:phage tail protein [Salmonella enterica subsp. diarizonae]
MSRFTTPAILEMIGHYNWRVYEPFAFYLSDDESDVIEVPAGFITDLATVPRVFWILLPPDGKYAKAAIIHDYLYDNALRTKKEADRIFLDGMTVLGVPKWKRTVMYYAVKLFGRGNYHKLTNRGAI